MLKKSIALSLLTLLLTSSALCADQVPQYKQNEIKTIEYFEKLQLEGAGIGKKAEPSLVGKLSGESLKYLAAAYYYCVLDNQICSFFPESIFEADVINARLTKKYHCPIMLSFWKQWIDADYEKQVTQKIQTGRLYRYKNFKEYDRIRYTSCSDTVRQSTSSGLTQKDFFALRYKADAPSTKSIASLLSYLKKLHKDVPDVFVAAEAKSKVTR